MKFHDMNGRTSHEMIAFWGNLNVSKSLTAENEKKIFQTAENWLNVHSDWLKHEIELYSFRNCYRIFFVTDIFQFIIIHRFTGSFLICRPQPLSISSFM